MPRSVARGGAASAATADRNPVTLWIVLAGATLLRLLNLGSPLTNDEAISALAARGVAATGVPLFPSGIVYVRDPLYHYTLGAAFALPGPDELAGRLLGVGCSLAAVVGAHRLALALFGSPAVALGAGLLAAIDPFSASYAGRLRMYSALQAAVVWMLVFFERDFVPRRPRPESPPGTDDGNPAPAGFALPALVLFAAAFLVQRLAALLVPALAVVWVAERGWRRSGLRWLAPAALLAAAVLAPPYVLPHLREPSGLEAVQGTYLSAPDLEASARAGYLATLAAKLPRRLGSVARVGLLIAAVAIALAGVLRRPAWRRPGLRLAIYALLPAALVLLWPSGVFFDARYFLHLLPLAAVLLAAGAAAWAPVPAPAPTPAVALAAVAASACFLLWDTPLWELRYPVFLLPFVAGLAGRPAAGAAGAPDRADPHVPGRSPLDRLGGSARRAARALAWSAAAVAFALPLTGAALWWTEVLPFGPVLRHAAAQHERQDVVLADGHVPLVAWRLGEVDGATPNYNLNFVYRDRRALGDAYAGAVPVESVTELAALARRARVWWFVYRPPNIEPGRAAFTRERVEPLRRYAAERFHRAVTCGDFTLYDSRPSDPGAPTLDCDLRPLAATVGAP